MCCALALQREGYSVTLIDQAEAGMGCSFGSAGMIQTGSVLTLAQPGILRRVPRMLLDPEAALVLRWRQLPRLLPWLAALLQNAHPDRVAANARHLARLLSGAKQAFRTIANDPAVQAIFRPRGELYVFPSERTYTAATEKFPAFRDHGIEYLPLLGDRLVAFEPAISPAYRHGYYLPDSEYVVDPLRLSKRLFDVFLAAGGTFVHCRVEALCVLENGLVRLTGSGVSLVCERLVLAAGAASGSLSGMLGITAPIEPLRGYHVMVPGDGVTLSGPVIEGVMNIAATPMAEGIRLAGTLEFAGFTTRPNWRRSAMLAPMAQRMLPGLSRQARTRWFGDRPGTPDGLPVIGRAPNVPNIWCAFGHGMLGLTLAAVTGQLIAQAVVGAPTAVDLNAFRPDRFAKARC